MRGRCGRVLVLLLLLAALVLLKLSDLLSSIDETAYAALPRTRSLTVVILSETASVPVQAIVVALLAILAYLGRRGSLASLAPLAIGFIAVNVLSLTMKLLVAEPRPPGDPIYPVTLGSLDTYSFPSGHTARASFLAHLLASERRSLAPYLYAYAVAIGVTRLVLSVHWFSDVLCGFVLGILIAELVRTPSPLTLSSRPLDDAHRPPS